MLLREPTSIEECIYFTTRTINSGKVKAWVFKEKCSKCGKALMSKPRDKKGKIKIRAKEYVCSECNYIVPKEEYEQTLTVHIKYTCPYCAYSSEISIPFKRKKITRLNEETGKKQLVETIRFKCEKCSKDIDITKKMK